jgi:hypothetical protein
LGRPVGKEARRLAEAPGVAKPVVRDFIVPDDK